MPDASVPARQRRCRPDRPTRTVIRVSRVKSIWVGQPACHAARRPAGHCRTVPESGKAMASGRPLGVHLARETDLPRPSGSPTETRPQGSTTIKRFVPLPAWGPAKAHA
jgi:hypothetical protein